MPEYIEITEKEKDAYNKVVGHPLQSYEWGEFRKQTGVEIIRRGVVEKGKLIDGFTLTLHKIPHTPYTVGYLPKGKLPTKELLAELAKIAQENKTIFIKLEPDILEQNAPKDWKKSLVNFVPSFHPLFTKYTFLLDITKSTEGLLQQMHHKTRYNIRLAQRKGVYVEEDNSKDSFMQYLKLNAETTQRQRFYAHTSSYHEKLWETLPKDTNRHHPTYHLFHAKYKDEKDNVHTLVSWVLFVFHDKLYYPYGASTHKFRELMASNLIAYKAIEFGKRLQLKEFDMWGALSPNPDTKDPWYGFHRFKEGYGGQLSEYVGSYDFVTRPTLYSLYKIADKLRWMVLRLRK